VETEMGLLKPLGSSKRTMWSRDRREPGNASMRLGGPLSCRALPVANENGRGKTLASASPSYLGMYVFPRQGNQNSAVLG